MSRFRATVLLFLALNALRAVIFAQPTQTLDQDARKRVIAAAARLLQERYVFPDVGKKCGDHISGQLAAGAFDEIADPKVFAERLTRELQGISHDKHMRVQVPETRDPRGVPVDPAIERLRMLRIPAENNYGFARAEVMPGNVGYLEITGFPPMELARPTAEAAMDFLANVDALVIDLRRNGGGSPDLIQLVCSYFFGEKTHLNSLYWREGNSTQEFWTLDSLKGKRRPDLPLFVLTSHRTFSGGEEFAYNLKTRKRATLIGDTTGGGANPGGFFPLDPPIGMFIPTGRAINPVTNDNWEGKGVVPDIRPDSAAALDTAFTLAKGIAAERRKTTEQRFANASAVLTKRIDEVDRFLKSGKGPEARTLLTSAFDEGRAGDIADESYINQLGYGFLEKSNFEMAIEVFSYNARTFPGSWNVYDSLGEAFMKQGDTKQAIASYRKSLTLNKDNEGARKALRSMGAEH